MSDTKKPGECESTTGEGCEQADRHTPDHANSVTSAPQCSISCQHLAEICSQPGRSSSKVSEFCPFPRLKLRTHTQRREIQSPISHTPLSHTKPPRILANILVSSLQELEKKGWASPYLALHKCCFTLVHKGAGQLRTTENTPQCPPAATVVSRQALVLSLQ